MLEFFPIPLIAGLGILVFLISLLRRHQIPPYIFCFAVFWVYILLLLSKTIFPIPLPEDSLTRWPVTNILSRVNLIPFRFGHLFENHPNVVFRELFGNVLLTVPFGFSIPFVAVFRAKNISWLAIGLGLAIETAQLGFCLVVGGSYRSVDVNDVLLNAAGVLLGYSIFQGFAWLYLVISAQAEIKQRGLFAYVHEVAMHGVAGKSHPSIAENVTLSQ